MGAFARGARSSQAEGKPHCLSMLMWTGAASGYREAAAVSKGNAELSRHTCDLASRSNAFLAGSSRNSSALGALIRCRPIASSSSSYHCKVMAENATLRREVNALREASSHVPMKLSLICGASSLRVAGSRCACSATQARRSSTLHVYGEGTKEGEESVWEKDIALRGTPRATSVACTHTHTRVFEAQGARTKNI